MASNVPGLFELTIVGSVQKKMRGASRYDYIDLKYQLEYLIDQLNLTVATLNKLVFPTGLEKSIEGEIFQSITKNSNEVSVKKSCPSLYSDIIVNDELLGIYTQNVLSNFLRGGFSSIFSVSWLHAKVELLIAVLAGPNFDFSELDKSIPDWKQKVEVSFVQRPVNTSGCHHILVKLFKNCDALTTILPVPNFENYV